MLLRVSMLALHRETLQAYKHGRNHILHTINYALAWFISLFSLDTVDIIKFTSKEICDSTDSSGTRVSTEYLQARVRDHWGKVFNVFRPLERTERSSLSVLFSLARSLMT